MARKVKVGEWWFVDGKDAPFVCTFVPRSFGKNIVFGVFVGDTKISEVKEADCWKKIADGPREVSEFVEAVYQ